MEEGQRDRGTEGERLTGEEELQRDETDERGLALTADRKSDMDQRKEVDEEA